MAEIETGLRSKTNGLSLYFQVIFAIILGASLGYFYPKFGEDMKPLGDGFIKLVKMIISPVIFLTIVTGIAGIGNLGRLSKIFGIALLYFLFFSTLALFLGLASAFVFHPGVGMNIAPETLDMGKVSDYIGKSHELSIKGFLLDLIPETYFSAFTSGNILQVLLVAILSGIVLSGLGEKAKPIMDFLHSAQDMIFGLVNLLMRFAPIGAFGAFAFTIGKYGISTIVSLSALVGSFYFTSAVFIIVILGLVAYSSGFSIFGLIKYLKTEIFLVLGTSSSESALPSLMEKLHHAGAAKEIVGIVVPSGYSFNLDGTNIYLTLAAMFIAQACNIHLSNEQIFVLLVVAVISSKGAAGVTGAGFITLAATLSVVPTLPLAGMALILGVDRFMSECRSITNFIGNAVAALVIANWLGGLDKVKLQKALA